MGNAIPAQQQRYFWKPIRSDVQLNKVDTRCRKRLVVLQDKIADHIATDIFASEQLDPLHPVKVPARRVKNKSYPERAQYHGQFGD